jgi:protein involved in polysaccharide export with SLBB domain
MIREIRIPHLLVLVSLITGLSALLALASQSFAQTEPSPVSPETQAETDLVHFGDLIDVDVVGSFEYDWRGTLNPEGFLDGTNKLEEPIFALCRSEIAVADELSAAFSKFLRSPKVVVRIIDRSRRAEAVVSGAVRNPYRFQIKRPVRLNELIVLSGGITDRSNGEIVIFRPESLSCAGSLKSAQRNSEAFIKTSEPNGSRTFRIRVSDILKGDSSANPHILSGDIITVTEAAPIFVIGGVNNPRQLSSRSQITLSRAIASSGGLTKDAIEDKVTIYRRVNGQPQMINADLAKIETKAAEDVPLMPYDIVDVGQKGREKRRFPPNVESDASRSDKFAFRLKIVD